MNPFLPSIWFAVMSFALTSLLGVEQVALLETAQPSEEMSEVQRFERGNNHLCGEDTVCLLHLQVEISACKRAGDDKCYIDFDRGVFALRSGYYFIDTDCDGVRGILNEDVFVNFMIQFDGEGVQSIMEHQGKCYWE